MVKKQGCTGSSFGVNCTYKEKTEDNAEEWYFRSCSDAVMEAVMIPVNIFSVSRIRDEELFNIAEKHAAGDHDNHRIRIHEIDSLRIVTDALIGEGITIAECDGFYFGFIIPQIGKEFDMLKLTDRYCLNIELKSQDVTEESILAQLRKNRHYLGHLGKTLMLYTVVTDTMTCYRLSRRGNLVRTTVSEIAGSVRKCATYYEDHIERLFRASEYLISPEENPDKFLQNHYFLTPAQDYVKSEILKSIRSTEGYAFYHITGRPCTGKTLLLYDLARYLSGSGRTLLVCGGEPSEGLRIISKVIENLDFIYSGNLDPASLSSYDHVLIDESQRLESDTFILITDTAKRKGQICIFSTDPDAILTLQEKDRDIAGQISGLSLSGEYELKERLRMNMELFTFIRKLRHLSYVSEKSYEYSNVSINYARNENEAREIVRYFRGRGYVFINAHRGKEDRFADVAENFGTRHITGREYSKVVLLLDSSLYYDEEGFLRGIPQPDPDQMYPNLFYPDITRVRDRLAVVILDAPELLRGVLSIIG